MTAFREIRVDLDAVHHNVARIIAQVAPTPVLVVVKADGYGHGAVPIARAAVRAGARWLGVVDLAEAVALRAGGITAPILSWMHAPDESFERAVEHDIIPVCSYAEQVEAAAAAGVTNLQLMVDTGLSRNGAGREQWAALFSAAAALERSGAAHTSGIMSHLSGTSREEDLRQAQRFDEALALAVEAGLDPEMRHLTATAGTLDYPEARFTAVRLGISTYGLAPDDRGTSASLGLRPAMRVAGRIAQVKRVPAGAGLSYGFHYRTAVESTLALVPFGYADGIPRIADGAPVLLNGKVYHVSGQIAMDQFIVDVGDDEVRRGDEVVLFGDPERGEPAVEEWAAAAQTINYEIVTRMGHRPQRVYVGVDA